MNNPTMSKQSVLVRPQVRHRARSTQAGQLVTHLILLFIVFISVMPFVWMFFGSFKSYVELTANESLLPKQWTLASYEAILYRSNFVAGLRNSVITAFLVTGATLLTSAAAGYVFAKYTFWGKEMLFVCLLSTLMVPFAVVMIPLYVTVADFGLINKLGGIIVTGIFSTFGIFMLRQFMEGIPSDLLDAGRIDGATEWWLFARVIVPLSTSPLAALAVFTFLGNWDSYLWPLVVLSSPNTQTLPLVLAGLRNLYWDRYDIYMAGSMLTVAPVMLLYAAAQQHFIRGVTMTGLKA
jgi:ABC-type glycerol-3-phosphate transport system permease component